MPDQEYYWKHRQKSVEYSRAYRKKHAITLRRKYKLKNRTLAGKYRQYKSNARTRRIGFSLTIKQFSQFWKRPCHYCAFEIKTIGLDRINNKKGYHWGNIVPCCTICNVAKNTLEPIKFIRQCARVVYVWNKKFRRGSAGSLLRALGRID